MKSSIIKCAVQNYRLNFVIFFCVESLLLLLLYDRSSMKLNRHHKVVDPSSQGDFAPRSPPIYKESHESMLSYVDHIWLTERPISYAWVNSKGRRGLYNKAVVLKLFRQNTPKWYFTKLIVTLKHPKVETHKTPLRGGNTPTLRTIAIKCCSKKVSKFRKDILGGES